jgi:hypothetical protein
MHPNMMVNRLFFIISPCQFLKTFPR